MAESRKPSGEHPRWKQGSGESAAVAGSPTGSRRKLLIGLLLGILALAGAVAAWLLYPRPFQPPTFLGIWIDQYDRPVPWAEADRRAVGAIWSESNNAFTSQDKRLFLQELEGLSKQPEGHPLVLFLAAHVRRRPQGDAGLLMAHSSPDRPDTWVPLEEVFQKLKACPAREKLLLLDVMQPAVDPRAGLLADEAASLVWPQLQQAVEKDSNLRIFTACSPGQVSLSSEGLGHTAFAYFLVQGLRGRAEKRSKGRITLKELAEYVPRAVDEWAWRTFGQRQTPCLLQTNKDKDEDEAFPLAILSGPPPAEDGDPPEAYLPWLSAAWTKRDTWWKNGDYRLALPGFVDLEALLLQAEQQWRGGADANRLDRLHDEVRRRQSALTAAMERQREELGPPASGSLAAAVLLAAKGKSEGEVPPIDPETLRKLRELAVAGEKVLTAAKPNEADKQRLDTEKADFVKEFKNKQIELCRALLEAAVTSTEPTPARLAFLASLAPEEAKYTEISLLRKLAQLPGAGASWPSRAAVQALRAVQLQEAIAAGDPLTRPWIKTSSEAARSYFQQELARLLAAPGDGDGLAAELERAVQALQKVTKEQETVAQALQARDRTLVLLFALAVYCEEAEADRTVLADLESAADAVGRLRQALAGPGRSADLARLTAEVNGADVWKGRAQDLNGKAADRLIDKRERATLADGKEIRTLLRLTSLGEPQRVGLWKTSLHLARRLQSSTGSGLPPQGREDHKRAHKDELTRALWRARLAVLWYRLRDERAGEELQPLLDAALTEWHANRMLTADPPPDFPARQALARKLAELWRAQRNS
jgi:hypothetical protein